MTTIEEAAPYYERIMNGTATEEDITMYKLIRSTCCMNYDFFDRCVKQLVVERHNTADKASK